MTWTKVEIAIPVDVEREDERLDVLSAALFEVGAGGLETKDDGSPILVLASFAPESAGADLKERVEAALEASALEGATFSFSEYEAVDWSTHWRTHFTAKAFGEGEKRLWVVPTWLEPPEGAAHVLRIDPSSAFGTGLHPTTAMCLEKIVELSPLESVLDVGTGSGILALAALELGARRVVATDNDPEALRVAGENAALNRFSERLVLSAQDPRALGERFKVVVANILARPLIDLAPEIAACVADGGRLILSGITSAQANDVAGAYASLGLRCTHTEGRDEWARLDLESVERHERP